VVMRVGPTETPTLILRGPDETGLPWPIAFDPGPVMTGDSSFTRRRLLFAAGFLLLVSLATVSGWLILNSINRELTAARQQSDFVAAVSHEFRTPLTSLRQFTDMLREHDPADAERRRLCYDAQARATERLTRLVESLLDFGRMEAGARPYALEPTDCDDLLRSVVDEFHHDIEGLGYTVHVVETGAATFNLDREAIARAIWNLLDNAVKYSPTDREIEAGIRKAQGTLSIWVRDRGIGVPVEERAEIFTRFRRGEEAGRRGIKGTGIGLAMVDHIVKAHGGFVDVESTPGEGSTFTIVLPMADRRASIESDDHLACQES
jgi:two-component system phosphate regulon sensor histidine kinase PhoR